MSRYLLVMLGAAVGGLARYIVGSAITQRLESRFPWGTLVVNITGCFLIGLLMTLFVQRHDLNPNLRLLLVTGVLGGYTTFSSFGWESLDALQKDTIFIGLANIILSVGLGLLAVWLGTLAARLVR
jgi:CrcB protein